MPPGPRIPGRGRGGSASGNTTPSIATHISTVGVRRSQWGTQGRAVKVATNHFEVRTPQNIIHHYDIVIAPADKNLPAKLNLDIIKELQESIPQVFSPKAVYDGRKNMFSSHALRLNTHDPRGQDSQSFDVILPEDMKTYEAAKSAGVKPRDPKSTKSRSPRSLKSTPRSCLASLQVVNLTTMLF